MSCNVAPIVEHFQIEGRYVNAESYGTGNINSTSLVVCRDGACHNQYVLQRINHSVFKNPPQVMDNILRVTKHIRMKLQEQGGMDIDRRVLTVIPTCEDDSYYQDADGGYWRMYRCIEDVRSWDYLSSPAQAYEAARMFGSFQMLLVDMPEPKLHETIPYFHHTPRRFQDFIAALESDSHNRAGLVNDEIQFVLERAEICSGLIKLVEQGEIPERITHNDTKINNVLFDRKEDCGICVIDLDTVMPGLSLYDFGDMVRTATCQAAEDEKDLSKIRMDITLFEQIVKGYAEATVDLLTTAEKKSLVLAGKLITYEQMIRFLGDYLNGDIYYKNNYPGHNLDRTRTQMKLIQSIEAQEDRMNQLAEDICRELS